jgi:Ca2+-binding EF-hand superfamily protein
MLGNDMKDQPQRPPKKSEMVEVRVSHETKRDFLAACRTAGRSASDVIREGMQVFIDRQTPPKTAPETNVTPLKKRRFRKRYLIVGVAATGLAGLAALPSAATPDFANMFAQLDTDKDGALTPEEFAASRPNTQIVRVRKLTRDAGSQDAGADRGSERAILVIPPDLERQALAGLQDVRIQAIGASAAPAGVEVRARDFASFDADKDGRISFVEYRGEFVTMLGNGFNRLDRDKDGALSAEEYSAIGQPLLLLPINADPTFGAPGKYGPIATPQSIDANFGKLDANKDGKLSLQEYLPAN